MDSPGIANAKPGFSLIEVLMVISMLSIIIIPFTMLMTQTTQNSQGAYTQANRSTLANTMASQIEPGRQPLYTLLHNASQRSIYKEPNSTFTGTRATIPFISQQDSTNSNALTKKLHLYEYKEGAADSSPRHSTLLYDSSDEIRIDLGNYGTLTDSSLRQWGQAGYMYNSAWKSYGASAPHGGPYPYTSTNPGNLYTSQDRRLYNLQDVDWPTPIIYDVDLPNGPYTVQLLFNEYCSTCQRQMDITIEGQKMHSVPYDPVAITGATARAHILAFDTYVWDNTLNVNISVNASKPNEWVWCSGIAIVRRDMP
jgi:prepilin-type N-terminal cleavage/methylation domain-containing protein